LLTARSKYGIHDFDLGDLGGRITQLALANYNRKLKRCFSFRRIENLSWFSETLKILPCELDSSLTQLTVKPVHVSDSSATTVFKTLCNGPEEELS